MGEGKDSHRHQHHYHDEEQPPTPPLPSAQYGTFQGVPNYPSAAVIGFPQPVPPPGLTEPSPYVHGYQGFPVIEIQGYSVAEGRPVARERHLPCCGIGFGWFCFIIGFFLGGIPWYIASFIILCARVDPREKPGYIACAVAAIIAVIALVFGLPSRDWDWD